MHISSVTFGNTLIKSSIDLLVEQQDQIHETNENVDEAKQEYRSKFDQTDSRITLEVDQLDKSIAAIDIKADNINLSVNNRITNEVAAIDIRANQIALSVSNLEYNSSASINILQNSISLKVDANNLISSINMSPESISISASKINLNGAVMANGSITGSSTINVGTDLYVGNNVYLANGSGGTKSIQFGGISRITGDWSNIGISASNVKIDSNVTLGASGSTVAFNGNVNFQYADSIIGVARANSSGIGISTSGGNLYVQVNGSTIGSVKLT
ncbi:hypothetical protein MKZ17_19220 [Solibacillus sp. FSL R7-0682]|uniref:hypothetical protein n=1 Tax=Solibacillus sp. FSL R7-0682 TaxID=2921690 RepID=UPI0030F70365